MQVKYAVPSLQYRVHVQQCFYMTWSVSHVQYVTFSIIGCPILELFQSLEKLSYQAGWEC